MMLQASPARQAAAAAARGGRRHPHLRSTATASASPAPGAPRLARSAAVVVRAAQEKVNKRGKVASRPGTQPSPKEQAKVLREQRQANRLADAAAPASVADADADAAPVDPSLDDTAARSSPPAAASPLASSTPQVVVDRMFRRMLVSAGAPVLLGLLLLPAFWYARVVAKIEYPPWLVYLTQGVFFGGGLLGITYGILSTSWEPRREGSALGFEEFKANVAVMTNKERR